MNNTIPPKRLKYEKWNNCDNVIIMPHKAGPTTNLRKIITHDLLIESSDFVDNGGELPDEITRNRAMAMSKS